jgi:uncharacterized protein YraI
MKCQFLLAAALCLSVAGAFAADEAIVKAARVNVRGQPTTGSEVVTQLKQGEKITVLEEIVHPKPGKDEPAKWLRIALPSNTPVWVSTLFLTNGTVAVSRLNIRSGPGENFSVIGRVPKGATLKELRRNGDWLEIEAPANTFAYIAADLVVRQAGGPAPKAPGDNTSQLAGKSSPKAPGKATDKSGKQMAKVAPKAPPISAPDTKPALEPVEVKPITPAPIALAPGVVAMKPAPVAPPAAVFAPAPVAPAAVPPAPAPEPVKVAPPAALTENVPPPADPYASTGRYKIEPEPQRGVGAWFKGLFSRKPAAEKAKPASTSAARPAVVNDGPPPIRVVSREGVVARSWNLQTPSDWALQDAESGRVINYLWSSSTNIPWATLKGRTIIVTGEEALDVRWPNTPVLKIETLKTVEE